MLQVRKSAPRLLVIGAALISLAILSLRISTAFTPPNYSAFVGWDDSYYYFWLRSVVIDHDVDFSNEIELTNTMNARLKAQARSSPKAPTGLLVNRYSVGWALGSAPFFLLGHAVALGLRGLGVSVAADGFSPPYQIAVLLGQWLYAWLGLLFVYRLLGRFFTPRRALVAVALTWLSSSLLFYQSKQLTMAHNLVVLGVAASFWMALRLEDDPRGLRRWLALGFFSGLVLIARPPAAIHLIFVAFIALRALRRDLRGVWWRVLASGVAAFLTFSPQLMAWKALYGAWIVNSYAYEGFGFNWGSPAVWQVLFSPRNGWFYVHPAMLIGTLGFLLWLWRERQILASCWAASLALVTYLNAAWCYWWFGLSFGQRAFEAATIYVMAGVAYLLRLTEGRPRWRAALYGLFGLLIAWNINYAAMFMLWRQTFGEPVNFAVSYAMIFEISWNFWGGFLARLAGA